MEQKGRDTPKIIIYCPTVNSVDDVYDELMNALDRKAYVDGRKTFKNRMIAKFYAEAGEETKKYIMKKVTKSDSKIRVVVATIAFGLGVNITNVRYVVHWGIPKNHLAYWQPTGRKWEGRVEMAKMQLQYCMSSHACFPQSYAHTSRPI